MDPWKSKAKIEDIYSATWKKNELIKNKENIFFNSKQNRRYLLS